MFFRDRFGLEKGYEFLFFYLFCIIFLTDKLWKFVSSLIQIQIVEIKFGLKFVLEFELI